MSNYLILGSNYLQALKDIQAKGGDTSCLADSKIDIINADKALLAQTMRITDALVISGNIEERLRQIIAAWADDYDKTLYIWASNNLLVE